MAPIIFIFILYSCGSFAGEEFKVFVNTFDKSMNPSSIESKNVFVKQGLEDPVSEVALLPPPVEMEKMFFDAGLRAEVHDLDQMDRDILYMKVQRGVSLLQEKKAHALKKIIDRKK